MFPSIARYVSPRSGTPMELVIVICVLTMPADALRPSTSADTAAARATILSFPVLRRTFTSTTPAVRAP